MSLQEAASQAGRRATKFCPANVQKIKDFVAQGMSRHEIAELLDVPLGSLQVTSLAAAVRNVGMTQLLTEIVITAIKKGMIEEILREPAQERAPPLQAEDS